MNDQNHFDEKLGADFCQNNQLCPHSISKQYFGGFFPLKYFPIWHRNLNKIHAFISVSISLHGLQLVLVEMLLSGTDSSYN